MRPERWRQIETLYLAVLAQPETARAAFLETACSGDTALQREVESLLAQPSTNGQLVTAGAVAVVLPTLSDDAPSSILGLRLGIYQIQSLLGAGGMGEVYRARDTRLGRDVAIKILPREFTRDPEHLARFEREARVLASLNHPHIGAIYGLEEANGLRALVLELVDGETLAVKLTHVSTRTASRSGLPIAESLGIARQIAEALEAAHEKAVVHRDLKPANVKITPEGVVKVLDFGIAKLDLTNRLDPALTHSPTVTVSGTEDGLIIGTAAYMSPEQARGLPIDKRTDIWAFGCVLYEMLTGRAVFGRPTLSDTLAAILERAPDWSALPGGTPATLRRVLERCLEKDPKRRIRDIGDVQLALEDIASDAPAERTSSGPDRFMWPFAMASLAAVVLGFAAVRPYINEAPRPPAFSRVTQIGTGQVSEFGPAISPDGKWIAYLSNARGPTDVWVRFLAGGDPVNLTASTTLEIQSRPDLGGLAISPDGSSVAFDAGATKGTPAPDFDAWVVSAPLGGSPRKVVERGRALRWSPDGTQIVFVRPGSSAGDALFVARSDGGSPRQLVALRGGMHLHWPVWSSDGKYVYFNYSTSTANREPAEIHRVPAAGGPVEPFVATARRAVFPLPTPDGKGLIYSANPTSVDLALWWRPFDRPEATRLTTGVGEYAEASIASDGLTMISTLVQFRQKLTAFPMSGGASSSPLPITDGSTGDFDPVLSPAGNQLVFSSSRSGFQNLWTAQPDGSMSRALTSGNTFDERPAFSPDGKRLAFVSDRGGSRGIWIMNAEGGIPEPLVRAQVLDRLLWVPDGRAIVYAMTVDDVPTLQRVGVPDGTVQRLPTPGPALSPFAIAGDTIGYLEPFPGGKDQPNVNRIAFVRLTGEQVSKEGLRSLNLANGFAILSPDGRRLAGVVDPGGAAGAIWVADLNARTPFQKVTDLPPDVRPRGATWSAANDTLIVGTIQRTSHLVLFDQAK